MKIPNKILPIGFWQRGELVDVAWLERPSQAKKHPHLSFRPRPKCMTLNLNPTDTLLNRVMKEMSELPNLKKVQPLLISAVSPNCVWEKSIVLPQKNLTEEECKQQCLAVFEAELPIPIDQVWFDFHASPLKQGTLIEMSAVLMTHAQERRQALFPLPIQVLDSASHALMRAFHYLEETLPKNTVFIYLDEDYAVVMQERDYDFNVLQVSTQDPKSALERFFERYPSDTEYKVCIHTSNETDEMNEWIAQQNNWVQCKTTQPFIALGLALWTFDFGK